jgi:hypothetical protein
MLVRPEQSISRFPPGRGYRGKRNRSRDAKVPYAVGAQSPADGLLRGYGSLVVPRRECIQPVRWQGPPRTVHYHPAGSASGIARYAAICAGRAR